MDRHKASLILEFVLRQPIEDWLAKDILLRLPIATPLSPHLKKTLLLRCLSSVLSSGRLSDDTLRYLELLEEVDRSLGAVRASKTLRAAYAAVAAELTAAPLRAGDRPRFLEVVNSFWDRRMADLVMSEARRMAGKRLREWRRQILAAADSQVALEAVLRRASKEKAVEALRDFVRMALKEMGPPILELAAKEVAGKPDGGGDEGPHQRTGELEAARMPGVPVEANATAAAAAAMEPGDHSAAVAGAEGTARLPETGRYKHSVLSGQVDALGDDRISEVLGFLPIREVDHVQKALKSSCADLHKAVEDPLPNALQKAVEIQNSTLGLEKLASTHDANNVQNQTDLEKSATTRDADNGQNLADTSTPGPSIPNDLQATGVERSAAQDHDGAQCTPKPCPILLDRNPTACSYERDEDSIEDASDDLINSLKRPRLSTPRNQRASPLQIYEPRKFVKRRKAKRWTPQEEDTLREAVKNHGKGNWKLILQSYPGAFKDRTEVDLKDKWRNLTRSPWK